MTGGRFAISLAFLMAVVFAGLRAQMPIVALVIAIGLVVVIIQANQPQTQILRKQMIFDLISLVTIIPTAALTAFVAAEPGSLLPAERTALLQTGGMLLIVTALCLLLAAYLFPRDQSLMLAMLLPPLLTLLTLNFVLHDYRSQTVLAMLAVCYFMGALAVGLGSLVEEVFRKYVPAAFYVSTLLTGAIMFDPGLANVFDRDGPVQLLSMMLIFVSLAVFIAVPAYSANLSALFSGRQRRPRGRVRTTERGRNDRDSDDNAPDRGRPPV